MSVLGPRSVLQTVLALFVAGQIFVNTGPPALEQWLDPLDEISVQFDDSVDDGGIDAFPGQANRSSLTANGLADLAPPRTLLAVPSVSVLLLRPRGPPPSRQH